MNWRELTIFLILISLSILIRIPNLNAIFQGDEGYYPSALKDQAENGFSFKHPNKDGSEYWNDLPLAELIYSGYIAIMGYNFIKIRLFSLIFGILNLSLIFVLAKKVFDTKTALFSMALMCFSYWHIFESFMVDRDGNILMTVYLCIFLLYSKYTETRKNHYLFLISTLILIALFIKSSIILIVIILFFWMLQTNKFISSLKELIDVNISKFIKKNMVLIVNGVFLLIPLCCYWLILIVICTYYPDAFKAMFDHAIPTSLLNISLFSVLRVLIYLILWGSPLIFGLTIFSIMEYNYKKFPFLLWICVPLFAYSFSVYGGSIDRYLSVIIPATCILAGSFLKDKSQLILQKKSIIIMSVISLGTFVLFHLLSLIKVKYIYHNVTQYLINWIFFDWDFIFPFYGGSQPTFMLSFIVIGLVLLLSGILIFLYAIRFNRAAILLLFLPLTFSFSLFVIEECDIHPFFPDLRDTVSEIQKYYTTNNLSLPIITPSNWLRFYLNLDYDQIIDISNTNNIKNVTINEIKSRGGTIILVHYPNYEFRYITDLSWCGLKDEFTDKNIKMVSIYECPIINQ